jgi:uncharacterized protein YkwD
MFEQTNVQRVDAGLQPLKWNGLLVETSSHMAVDLKDRNDLSHTDSKGRTFKQRMRTSRYMPYVKVGENLASGFVKPEDALKALMKSSGHRKNILNPEFVELGISVEEHFVYGRVWVQHFGRKS